MKSRMSASFYLLPVFIIVCAAAYTLKAYSQQENSPTRVRTVAELNKHKISVNFEDATLKDALERLFRLTPVNHVIVLKGGIDGKINFSTKEVPFEGALVSILRSVPQEPLSYSDEQDVLIVSPGRTPGGQLSTLNRRVWADLKDVDVRYALKALMATFGFNYTVSQDVQGAVTIKAEDVSFEAALKKIIEASKVPITYRMDGNVYVFEPKGK
jgi:type II secretory pathway component HofQ